MEVNMFMRNNLKSGASIYFFLSVSLSFSLTGFLSFPPFSAVYSCIVEKWNIWNILSRYILIGLQYQTVFLYMVTIAEDRCPPPLDDRFARSSGLFKKFSILSAVLHETSTKSLNSTVKFQNFKNSHFTLLLVFKPLICRIKF